MPLDSSTVQIALAVLAPGGIAGLAVKLMLNGSKQRIIDIGSDVKDVKKSVTRLHVRVDAIELNAAMEEGRKQGREEALKEIARQS